MATTEEKILKIIYDWEQNGDETKPLNLHFQMDYLEDVYIVRYIPQNVKILSCGNCISLVELPENLISFTCSSKYMEHLPKLPETLIMLNCCDMKSLKEITYLPNNIRGLYIHGCNIFSLPPLPQNLLVLSIGVCEFRELPRDLPSTLKGLDCSHNPLGKLDTLPESLEFLNCEYNYLETLPELPQTLHTLICQRNRLRSFPTIPPSLHSLHFLDNYFEKHPLLPDTVVDYVGDNSYSDIDTVLCNCMKTIYDINLHFTF